MTEETGRHRTTFEETEHPEYVDDTRQFESADPAEEPADQAEEVASPAELDREHRERDDIGRPPPRWKALLLTPANGVWAGLAVVAAGFSAIFYSWGAVAGTLAVDEQMSPLISAGFIGLALIVLGLAAVDIAVRRQDRPERLQQVAQVERSVAELRDLRVGRTRARP
ncbi:phage holin family protein [Haloechinothrix halophila]|uniref:phage holin family protein n=1 Tax=Haloechinothrix halophila TaxID=1069073 RepID=UPI000429BA8B|nr:phage holin family protein [Haloechinothrix halophila]